MLKDRHGRRRSRALLALGAAALALTVIGPIGAFASHPVATLPGSNFEIDVDANLKVDHTTPPSLDWANVNDESQRQADLLTGANDDSYAGGAKEDSTCPSTTTGSIPNNKSDLLTFGAYQETQTTGPGFLHLFWTRVNEPSGTTLMDFELNQSPEDCGNGVNKERTVDDLLIEYRIEQGGATAFVKVRKWTGTAWSAAEDLTIAHQATGTINSSPIPFGDSDGLITSGSISPRTFGEMSLDLDFVFDEGNCDSFGSAFLKSRASDSFNSQLKDFIKPVNVSISNCGKVVIRKQTTPEEDPNTTTFGYTKSFNTDPATSTTFTLQDDGVQTYDETVLFGTGYTVIEDVVPDGWVLQSVSCAASSGVSPTISGATITFDIDAASDVLDCTYTNRAQSGAILITKTRKHAADGSGDHPHEGVDFTVDGVTKTTDSDGKVCFDGLSLSSHTVHEVTPTGYRGEADKTVDVDNDAACSDTPYVGETVSFANTPLTNITVSVDSQVDGGTASTITCDGTLVGSTNANGDGTATLSDLEPGTYTCVVVVDP